MLVFLFTILIELLGRKLKLYSRATEICFSDLFAWVKVL